ncbi:MAG: DUF4446 family protein [bacterium]|nr:DUF4446 family protein [bacterium]
MDTNIYFISLGSLGIIILILVFLILNLNLRIRKLLGAGGAKNIESGIADIKKSLEEIYNFKRNTENYLENVEGRLKGSVRGVHTVRFNPFKGTGSGGNQSFATAFVNEEGDGVIISSLYTREHVSIFSKPIKKNLSEFELTEEESDALKKAKQMAGK